MNPLSPASAAPDSQPPEVIEPIEVSHANFCRGLPAGHFRLIVNPEKARKYVRQRLFIVAISLPMSAVGVVLALSGSTWAGLGLILVSVLLNRVVTAQASKILLHLALRSARVYHEAVDQEILEVRMAR